MTEETPSAKKLDIFRVLAAADAKNVDFYFNLTDDEKKNFIPLVSMRWMSGTSSKQQVYLINEVINPYVFSLPNHKELLWKLLMIANDGKSCRYTWNKMLSTAGSTRPVATKVVAEYYGYSLSAASETIGLLSKDIIVEIATELGYQADDISKIRKELKGLDGNNTQNVEQHPPIK